MLLDLKGTMRSSSCYQVKDYVWHMRICGQGSEGDLGICDCHEFVDCAWQVSSSDVCGRARLMRHSVNNGNMTNSCSCVL
jgi:hypothetical protein